MVGALGFVTALIAYMMLVAFGLGFAVSNYAPALKLLRVLGVGYLLYLAYRTWNADETERLDGGLQTASYLKTYVQGALVCLTNPKAIIFMAVVLPQTLDADKSLAPQLVALGLCGALLSFGVHSGYSLLGATLGQWVLTPRARRISNRAISTVFVVAAVGLGLSGI